MKKLIAMLLALVMCFGLLAGCGGNDTPATSTEPGTTSTEPGSTTSTEPSEEPSDGINYTYHSYSASLGTGWNPHTWESNGDSAILGYLVDTFMGMQVLDSEEGSWQWIYNMATDFQDVTAEHHDDLTKFGAILPDGQTAEDTDSGYVYQIKIRDDLKWQDGTPIKAQDFVDSMKLMLDPEMRNMRANNYYTGANAAIAGAFSYYNSGYTGWAETSGVLTLDDITVTADGATTADGEQVMIAASKALTWLGGDTLEAYIGSGYLDDDAVTALVEQVTGDDTEADDYGLVPLNEANLALLQTAITAVPDWGETEAEAVNYLYYLHTNPTFSWDNVGLYAPDDTTLIYVTELYLDGNDARTYISGDWLVYEPLYEGGYDTTGKLKTTNYMTSYETSFSYGPYMMESYQTDRQVTYVKNPEWWGWERDESGNVVTDENGSLVSYTNYEVDGEAQRRYYVDRIVVDIMEDSAAHQAFLKGELDWYTPTAEELSSSYSTSDQLVKTEDSYTYRLFFNTNKDLLKEMDASKGNTNSVVMSNVNFRKAMSLAIDREKYVQATPGYAPATYLLNNLYVYNIWNDPTSNYRRSDAAMQGICDLYGVEYGEGTPYATLEDAYKSINGYNLTEAQALMKTACDELVASGDYVAGEPIYIRVAWSGGAIDSAAQNQCRVIQDALNEAVQGSGFGEVTLEPLQVPGSQRYDDVPAGEYAIGYGAWGGGYFYPFTTLRVYLDPSYMAIHEAGCWDPTTETLTLNVEGQDVTMTWQAWSQSLDGNGQFATSSMETRLYILSQLEKQFLEKFYCIPLASKTDCTLMGYKYSYYTYNYSVMYQYGGLELYQPNYTDAEWTELVASQGGTLNYE